MRKIKKIIKLMLPLFVFKIRDYIKYNFLSTKYKRFTFKTKKSLFIDDFTPDYILNYFNLYNIKFSHIDTAKPTNKKRLYILSNESALKYQPKNFVFFYSGAINYEWTKQNFNLLIKAVSIICKSIDEIKYLSSIGLRNLIYLPVSVDEKTPYDLIFLNNESKGKFFFNRFLLFLEIIDFSAFYQNVCNLICLNNDKVCINLAESPSRLNSFMQNKCDDYLIFPGLKHRIGWLGCALSYKTISHFALKTNFSHFIICEDDAVFKKIYYKNIDKIFDFVKKNNIDLANFYSTDCDAHSKSKNFVFHKINDVHLIKTNKACGAVLNIYSRNFLKLISQYNEKNVSRFTYSSSQMDQYTARHASKYSIFCVCPFLVEHNINEYSDINNVKNDSLIYNMSASIQETILLYRIKQK